MPTGQHSRLINKPDSASPDAITAGMAVIAPHQGRCGVAIFDVVTNRAPTDNGLAMVTNNDPVKPVVWNKTPHRRCSVTHTEIERASDSVSAASTIITQVTNHFDLGANRNSTGNALAMGNANGHVNPAIWNKAPQRGCSATLNEIKQAKDSYSTAPGVCIEDITNMPTKRKTYSMYLKLLDDGNQGNSATRSGVHANCAACPKRADIAVKITIDVEMQNVEDEARSSANVSACKNSSLTERVTNMVLGNQDKGNKDMISIDKKLI